MFCEIVCSCFEQPLQVLHEYKLGSVHNNTVNQEIEKSILNKDKHSLSQKKVKNQPIFCQKRY